MSKGIYKRTEFHYKVLASNSPFKKGRFTGDENPSKRPEVREKISEKMKGRQLTSEWIRKISEGRRGISSPKPKGFGEARRGFNNPNWRGGDSFYSSSFDERLRVQIRKRDNHTCQICKLTRKQVGTLSVHHIDYKKKNSNPRNLIALCSRCHMATNGNREYWKKILEELQKVRLSNDVSATAAALQK